MTTPFRERYRALDPPGQARLLAKIAGALTLAGRTTYVAGTDEVADSAMLRRVNEAQHQVTAQLAHLLDGDERRYPDDVFVDILAQAFRGLGVELDTWSAAQ